MVEEFNQRPLITDLEANDKLLVTDASANHAVKRLPFSLLEESLGGNGGQPAPSLVVFSEDPPATPFAGIWLEPSGDSWVRDQGNTVWVSLQKYSVASRFNENSNPFPIDFPYPVKHGQSWLEEIVFSGYFATAPNAANYWNIRLFSRYDAGTTALTGLIQLPLSANAINLRHVVRSVVNGGLRTSLRLEFSKVGSPPTIGEGSVAIRFRDTR
ncbi:hypothetical protein [Almyronema epifaneia]|uniref:Uncharacterized protein n=1 Tax=Almyronema epifaneia S1 TaxID=2991925 RepID=A0ABW6IK21_9CYAN